MAVGQVRILPMASMMRPYDLTTPNCPVNSSTQLNSTQQVITDADAKHL